MKKVVITGHCSGIGKSLTDIFEENNYQVVGFDIADGHDISDELIRTDIIKQAETADIFINNAYAPIAQTLLLKMILESWANQKKLIININSKISLLGFEGVPDDRKNPFIEQYYYDKHEQLLLSRDYIKKIKHPYLMNVLPGFVMTDFTKKLNITRGMKPQTLAKLIFSNIEFISEIVVNELLIDSSTNPVNII